MPQPTPYTPDFDFTDFSASFPSTPTPGYRLDAEFNAIDTTLDGVLTNLALIQRDDGALKNGVVTIDSLAVGTADAITAATADLAAAAAASAAAAAASAGGVSASAATATAAASAAGVSATAADASADAAAASLASIGTSVSDAAASAATATTKAGEASTSATAADVSKVAAAASALAASNSATAASGSATAASASATAASGSATTAAGHVTTAGASATAAAASQTAAGISETNAAASAAAAAASVVPTAELIRDTIGTALVAGTNITITVNDAGDIITIDATGGGGSVPTGTGFTHITAGAQDAAARLVLTADITDANVTLAKLANIASGSVFYRKSASAGPPEEQTLATLKTDLGLTGTNSGDQTTISGLAGSATILATARTISITGKGTAAGGTFDGSGNLAINITAVTLVAGDIPTLAQSKITNLTTDLAAKAAAFATVGAIAVSTTAADSHNNSHQVMSGASKVLTLNSTPTAGCVFSARFTTAWTVTCTSLSKNGATPASGGSVAAGKLVTFLHEGAGTWLATGDIT